MFGLPLTVVDVGTSGLERELERLLAEPAGHQGPARRADSRGGP